MREVGKTPAARGYRMPAEWEPHEATWFTWPQNAETWLRRFDDIPRIWVEMVRLVVPGEAVHILVNDELTGEEVRDRLASEDVPLDNLFLHMVPSDDAWARDHGPTFVTRTAESGVELAMVDWEYNAWGGKYPPWDRDAAVARRIAESLGVERFEPGIVLEGGAIDVNGQGTVLTSEECLLNSNRNPGLGRSEVESVLRDYLGVRKVLWLGSGIVGDDTDGHVDELARFVGPSTVVAASVDDPADENYEALCDNLERLQQMTDQDGRALGVIPLPMPDPVVCEGERLPASYTNFYVANDVVMMPTFGQEKDADVLETLQSVFPGRRVVGVDATSLVQGYGAIHCVTQQQPWSGSTKS